MLKYRFLFMASVLFSCNASGQRESIVSNKASRGDSLEVVRSPEEWEQILTPEQFYVLREKGTERPFSGEYYLHHEVGTYYCAACGNELFTSAMKFDSSCGWPSFDREVAGGKIKMQEDRSHGMVRTEIMCARCGSHLGHLFDDGPTLTGKRYCVNSVSLDFKKK